MRGQVKTLLLHPSVHSVNIHDPDACRRTLDTMVQSDSLPKKNAYEGRARDTPWKNRNSISSCETAFQAGRSEIGTALHKQTSCCTEHSENSMTT